MNRCAIIMYHYVRELENTRYPKIKGRRLSDFKSQIRYLEDEYEFLTIEDCIDAVYNEKKLPDNSALLTFDDGYKDHYENVFPILEEKNIQGCFFPSARAMMDDEILDVNKIHFILAVNEEEDKIDGLLDKVYELLDEYRKEYNLNSNEEYYSKLAVEGSYDPEEIIFIKRLFQKELPESLRRKMVDALFKEFVGVKEKVFSNELYMNMNQLKCMQRNGMYIGSHGYDHYWLNSISQEKLVDEIDNSIDFLKKVGTPDELWTFCYPYGAYNDDIIKLLQEKGFKLGFTTEQKKAEIEERYAMELPRLDTNDIPY